MSSQNRDTIDLLRAEVEQAEARFSEGELQQFATLMEQIQKVNDVRIDALQRPVDSSAEGSDSSAEGSTKTSRWRVAVSAADKVGVLSIIAGLFATRDIHILSAEILTVKFGTPAPSKPGAFRRTGGKVAGKRPASIGRKILDVFDVSSDRKLDEPFWSDLQTDLRSLITTLARSGVEPAREEIMDAFAETLRSGDGPLDILLPIDVDFDNDVSEQYTAVYMDGLDTPGYLFSFSNALVMLDVNINRVRVRNDGIVVNVEFLVSSTDGKKITDHVRLNEIRLAATLIKQFTYLLPRAPDPAQALKQFGALTRQLLTQPGWIDDIQTLGAKNVLEMVADLMGASQFLWEDFLRMQHANLFPVIRDVPGLDEEKSKDQLQADLQVELDAQPSSADQVRQLNDFKDREMFRIDLRHITQRVGFVKFSEELSDLAEVSVQAAMDCCHQKVSAQYAESAWRSRAGDQWCLVSLGKFGGRELGFASDIELIFVYSKNDRSDETDGAAQARFFEDVVSRFLQTLTARRKGIFEIDLRLRPYGSGGTLASSLDQFRQYFNAGGDAQPFERMALVKLRPVAGAVGLGQSVCEARDEFVYTERPLDYGNILYLRERQIKELVATGAVSAKHGRGGLVDVEYFVQARQIEVGRQCHQVRVTNTLQAIAALDKAGELAAGQADRLSDAYGFLRRLIDALRAVRGHAKDLTVPINDVRQFDYLTRRLRYDSSSALRQDMDSHMSFADSLWDKYR